MTRGGVVPGPDPSPSRRPDGANKPAGRFAPIQRAPRLSDEVAAKLLTQIREGSLMDGEPLPSEREMSEQFAVSRTVVREAVRSLAAKGIVSVRPGKGLAVSRVEASAVRESMGLYLRGIEQLDYQMVHEVRTTIELQTASLAASRATPEEIRELAEVCEKMAGHPNDVLYTSRADVEFHRQLATLTHNPLFMILLDAIADVLLEIRIETMTIPGRLSKGLDAHRQILAQVTAGNPDGARLAMEEHLTESERQWKALGHGVAMPTRPRPGAERQ
jgi:GntR family transcriptional regulator, transcriptional repressor for pyruvate dehydrogenase complex